MEILLIILVVVLIFLNVFLVWKISFKKEEKKDDTQSLNLVMQQMNDTRRDITKMQEKVQEKLMDVARETVKSTEASRQVFGITEQLQNLEKVLKHQKQRGNLGEASLELILSNILPPTAYKTQFSFKNGESVDAVIMTKDGFIPVDAKFSLDNYNRIINAIDDDQKETLEKEFRNDLKKRIDETAKYIRPNEGTLPFAFMYIPAEGIYYDLLINEVGSVKVNTRNLIDYAYNDKKVIIVSPTTFSAYLQSVLYGFKAFQIEESAQEIRKYVGELQKHLKSYEEYHTKLGKTLGTAVNHYTASGKEFNKIDKDVVKITGSSMNIETPQLDKPDME